MKTQTLGRDHDRASRLTHDQVAEIVGDIDDVASAAIIATGATLEEFEEAVTWASGSSRLARELKRPLTGRVAELFEILTTDRDFEESAD